MRLTVQAPPGSLAESPEEALSALADIAEADGACRDEWLEKAITAGGATQRHVHVAKEPRYQVVKDAIDEAGALHARAMVSMKQAIRERLERAAREADTSRYTELLHDGD